MDSRFLLLSVFFSLFFSSQSQYDWTDSNRQRLNHFKKNFKNSQSDIIFFLDVSGSVPDYGFRFEKYFVTSLLNEFSVAFYSTRVAIVTFGERIKTNINYISLEDGTEDTTKCEFKKEFEYKVKHREGRATNMKAAFRTGFDLLQEAEDLGWKRTNVNTVAIMMTDGHWNMGNPVPEINQLKHGKYHVDIISIGVGWASHSQLRTIASSNDKVIYAKDFHQFKQLAKYIRGDAHERVYYKVSVGRCSTPCHKDGFCSCGTVGGKYVCACNAGFSGDGVHCEACPRGSYKDFPSPNKCTGCPTNSNTATTGSRSIRDCSCKVGYEGNPTKNIECTAVKCPPIAAPKNGQMTGAKCHGSYQAKCFFECNHGYLRYGPPYRECLSNKQWSGLDVRCDVQRCNDIPQIHNGSVICSGTKYQDSCSISCDRGYELIGSSRKVCQANGQWTGSDVVRCEAKKCPALRKLSFGIVEPVDCVTRAQNFGSGCIFRCNSGYTMRGNGNLHCKEDGSWSDVIPSCEDTQPPLVLCPSSRKIGTDKNKPTATVDFGNPEYGDNSQLFGNVEIKLKQNPEGIQSPHKFPLGVTTITYTVEDQAGNINRCSFYVEVEDKEPPRVVSCPKNKIVATKTDTAIVTWEPVIFKDNCGDEKLKIVGSNNKNNTAFKIGSYIISYTATDGKNPPAMCQFSITVTSLPCPYYSPPINGGITQTAVWGGVVATPSCNKRFDFATTPAQFYQCFTDGTWIVFPMDATLPWPDCTVVYNADARKGMEFQYFSGDCTDPAVQLEAKKTFLKAFDGFLLDFFPDYCDIEQSCTVENVQVLCGVKQPIGNRRKRGIPGKTVFIDVEVKMENKKGKKPEELVNVLNSIAGKVTHDRKLQTLQTGSQMLTYEQILENPAEISCRNGSVFGMNSLATFDATKFKLGPSDMCQSCPAGTHFNPKLKSCQDCPKDTYQEESGRFHCNKCPQGTFTSRPNTKNATECRAKCPAGEYSENGLENCQACAIGYYQHVEGSKNCIKCPGATITTSEGAESINECGVPCAPGSSSKTGVEPCELCPVGEYQSLFNQKKCSPCPDGRTTRGKGAVNSRECQALNPCALFPCSNEGVCKTTGNTYECVCRPGFQGDNCETEIDECESNPCYQGASCLDKVNGYLCMCPPGQTGQHCDQKVGSFCSDNPCVNGACIEEPDRFVCNCRPGFTGVFCESQINECASIPCENGGKCTDQHPGYDCQCMPGYNGVRCQIVQDGCASDPCENGAACQSLGQDFQCTCANGYAGKRCEINVNDCATLPCRNGGKCFDHVGGYTCECARNFGGKNCEIARPMNFDLRFGEDLGVGSSSLVLKNDITAFTVAFWMRVADANSDDPGTPLSYAVEHQGTLYDNALVIHDYSGFDVFINNERYITDVDADDGKWHHIAVSWASSSGAVVFYKDGSPVSRGTIQKNRPIPGGGMMILGQEQDIVGGNFAVSEAFYGSISQMNVWDSVLSDRDIQILASYCALDRYGSLVAWGDFLNGIDGNVETVQPSRACQDNRCWSNWVNSDKPSGSGDSESLSGICSNPRGYDCQTAGGLSIVNVEVNKTTCTPQGITCRNSDQSKQCPDFKVRANCPCSVSSSCNSRPCLNGGVCTNHIRGFQCKCKEGYVGKRCEKELGCADPRPFAYGTVFGSTYTSGSVVRFTCQSGFKLVGSSSLRCSKGQWTGQFPRCVDIDECQARKCHQQVCKNTLGGYLCSCGNGYKQAADGSCQDINECANNNGGCQGRCINTVGSFRCICTQGSGVQLTKDGLKCEDINECSSNGGRGPCDHYCVNTYRGYQCKCRPGFTANGDICRATKCKSLSPPHNGQKVPVANIRDIDDVVTFSCLSNYKLIGSKSRRCLADGTWSGVQGVCTLILCHSAPVILNGQQSGHNKHAGAEITYTCDNGYKLVGKSKLTCQTNRKWSDPAPRCIRTDCSEPSAPSNGKVVGSQSTIGSSIRYECSLGYTFAPNTASYAQCLPNKQWSNPVPTCQVVNCGNPSAVSNAQRTGKCFTYNSVVSYTCTAGYRISGSERRTCQADGTWSGTTPKCSIRSCGDPGTPVNGEKTGLDYTYGKIVTFKCDAGYRIVGVVKRWCQTSGMWSGEQPTCEIVNCGDPGIPSNGERTGSGTTAGNELNYECQPGFRLIGVSKLVCQQDGSWSAKRPTCDVSSCGGVLYGPSGSLKSPNYPNLYDKDQYCRWKISVPVNKKVLIRFKSLDSEYKNDYVTISDPKTQTLITVLSGINRNEMMFTSSSNEMEIKFISNGNRESIGFEATYEQVSCGGVVTSLGDVIETPSYPNNYPDSITCVWQVLIPGQQVSLEFEDFNTQTSFDILKVYNRVDRFDVQSLVAQFSGVWIPSSVVSMNGYMHLAFTTNARTNSKGFRAKVAKYKMMFGK